MESSRPAFHCRGPCGGTRRTEALGIRVISNLSETAPAQFLLALPFTHNLLPTRSVISEREAFTQGLQLRIATPHQLMARGWIVGTTKIASHPCHDAHRIAQQGRWGQAFFFT